MSNKSLIFAVDVELSALSVIHTNGYEIFQITFHDFFSFDERKLWAC